MGKNTNKEIAGVQAKDRKKVAKVKRISYTPETLAAAIAKNIRASIELRDAPISWKQQTWGEAMIGDIFDNDLAVDIKIPVFAGDRSYCGCFDCRDADTAESANGEVRFFQNRVGVACTSTACIAGWATSLSGMLMLIPGQVLADYEAELQEIILEYGADSDQVVYHRSQTLGSSEVYDPKSQQVKPIPEAAQTLLGLTTNERQYCFSEQRTEMEVLEFLDAIAVGKDVESTPGFQHSYSHYVREVYNADNDRYEEVHEMVEGCVHCKIRDDLRKMDESERPKQVHSTLERDGRSMIS